MDGIVKELEQAIAPVVGEIKEIRQKLSKLEAAGVKPDDTKVADLEARLAELEEKTRLIEVGVVGKPEQKRVDVDTALLAAAARVIPEDTAIKRAIDSSVIASAGKLNPEQADAFIDFVVKEQVALSMARVRRMTAPQALIEELAVSARKLRKATEGTAPSLADAVSAKRRELSTVEVIWAEDITLTFLEDNIERRGAENHIARLLATQFGNDLADLGWKGDEGLAATITDSNGDGLDDTTGLTQADHNFLRTNNGWLKIAGSDPAAHGYDAASATKVSDIFKAMLKLLPDKYRGLELVFFVPPETADAYANELANRGTNLGDTVMVQGVPTLRYFGYKVVADPYLRKEGNLSRRAILTIPDNLVFGIQRDITIDAQWQPRKRVVEYTITARNDYEFANADAVVLASNIPEL